MKYLILISLLIFSGCSEDEDGTLSCNHKELFSVWTSQSDGTIYDMRLGAVNTTLDVKYGSGSCSDSRGDFKILLSTSNTFDIHRCNGTTLISSGTYSNNCSLLTLNYDNGNTEQFK